MVVRNSQAIWLDLNYWNSITALQKMLATVIAKLTRPKAPKINKSKY